MHSSLHQCSQQKMNVKNLHYSLKNIPIPKDNAYLKCLIDKTSNFIRRIRWKAFFYEKRLAEQNQSEDSNNSTSDENEETFCNFGFNSPRTPPKNNMRTRMLPPFRKVRQLRVFRKEPLCVTPPPVEGSLEPADTPKTVRT